MPTSVVWHTPVTHAERPSACYSATVELQPSACMLLPCRCTVLDAVLQSDSSIANAVLQYEVALQHPENKAALEQAYDRWGLHLILVPAHRLCQAKAVVMLAAPCHI